MTEHDGPDQSRPAEGTADLAKGLAIVEAFGTKRSRMQVTDAARATETTPATARRCLLTLEAMGYVNHDGKYFAPSPGWPDSAPLI